MNLRRAQPAESREVRAWIVGRHYTRTAPPGYRVALEFTEAGDRVGAMLLGRPPSRELDPEEWVELTRMYFVDEAPRNTESHALSMMRRWVRVWMPNVKALLAYSDPAVGHKGTVYRADGWALFGRTRNGCAGWRTRPGRADAPPPIPKAALGSHAVTWEIRHGDVRALLRELPEGSVRVCVTSPPYWGLRTYGTEPQAWGGDPSHAHEWGAERVVRKAPAREDHSHGVWKGTRDQQEASRAAALTINTGAFCECGAWRGELGLEPTPQLYVIHIAEVFREVWRVLSDDGTLWINIGDCYATGGWKVGEHPGGGERGARWRGDVDRLRDDKRGYRGARLANGRGDTPAVQRIKTRALRDGTHCGKHTAMAAMGPMTQPNRMPLPGLKPKDLVGIPWRVAFALQADGWYLRRDIIWSKPNPMPESAKDRTTTAHEYLFHLAKSERYYYNWKAIAEPVTGGAHARGSGVNPKAREQPPAAGWDRAPGAHGRINRQPRSKQNESFSSAVRLLVEQRNKRSVWTIPTSPFPEAHFATFPQDLVEPCILAGSAKGDLVLDPFAGSGTVGVVALRHGRNFLGLELNPEYVAMARRRIAGPLFADQEAAR